VRTTDALAKMTEKMMKNPSDKRINTFERQHLNRRVLIRKRACECKGGSARRGEAMAMSF